MAFELSGTTITQSGTDTSPDGLAGLAGVTSKIVGGQTIYTLTNLTLVISGSLTINALTHRIDLVGSTTNGRIVDVLSGGSLITNSFRTLSGVDFPTYDVALAVRPAGTACFSEVYVRTGGSLTNKGATFSVSGFGSGSYRAVVFERGSTISITNGWVKGANTTVNQIRWGEGGSGSLSNFNVNGMTVENMVFCSFGIFGSLSGFRPLGAVTQIVSAQASVIRDFSPYDPTATVDNWNNNNLYLINALSGTSANTTGGAAGGNQATRFTSIQKEVVVGARSASDAAISGALVYVRDTNNGNRLSVLNIPNQLSDNIYITSTAESGVTPQMLVHVMHGRYDSGVVLPMKRDYRSKTTTAGADLFDLHVWAYGYQYRPLINQALKGVDVLQLSAQLADDLIVTLSQAEATALTSINTIDNLYDAAKNWKCQANQTNLEFPLIGSQLATASGSTLDLGGLNLVISSTASSAFSVDTTSNTVTIKSSAFTAGVKLNRITTTGTISVEDGVNIYGCSLSNLYLTSGSDLSGVTVTGVTVFNTAITGDFSLTDSTLNVLRNDGSGVLTFTNSGSTVADSTDPQIVVVTTPITATATVLPDTRVQLYNVTQAAILDNVFIAGTTYSSILSTANPGDVIRLRTTKKGYLPTEALAIFSGNSIGFVINQQVDTVYEGYGIDGALVTKFEADYVDLEVDLIVNTNFTAKEAYAWYSNAITTELGINLFYGGVTAIDAGNLRINTDVVNLLFDNDTAENVFQNDSIRIFRSDEQYPVKNPSSGGGGIDVVWRNQIFIAETGVSGLTALESLQLSQISLSATSEQVLALPTLADMEASVPLTTATVDLSSVATKADLTVVNNGVKKASLLIPHTDNLV